MGAGVVAAIYATTVASAYGYSHPFSVFCSRSLGRLDSLVRYNLGSTLAPVRYRYQQLLRKHGIDPEDRR